MRQTSLLSAVVLLGLFMPPLLGEASEGRDPGPGVRITDDEKLHQLYLEGIRLAFNWEYEASKKIFRQIDEMDPASPAGPFLLGALTLNTIQYYDPQTTKDEEKAILSSFETCIQRADRILQKQPNDFQAVFFKGAAHGFRGILRLQKAEFLSAASDARVGKAHMDRAIQLNPKFYDAYLGLGLYNYFMDTLPAIMKFLKALLFVPGGDRAKGLEQVEFAAKNSTYCDVYSKVVLCGIYLNFELDLGKAWDLQEEITREFPAHPWYALERGTILVYVLQDPPEAEKHYEALLERSIRGEPHYQDEIRAVTRYRLAQARYLNFKPRHAIADLEALIRDAPGQPTEIVSGSHLLLGEIYLRLGQTAEARKHLLKVKSLPDSKTYRHERMDNRIVIPKQMGLHQRASRLLASPADPRKGKAYSLATEGWGILRQGRFPDAMGKFDAALAEDPGSALAAFGRAEALAQSGQLLEALAQFEAFAARAGPDPPWFLRDSLFRAGLLLDRSGRRADAVSRYRQSAATPSGNYFHGLAAQKAAENADAWKEIGWPDL